MKRSEILSFTCFVFGLINTLFVALSWGNVPPVVSNVQVKQQNMTRLIEISYDVVDIDGNLLTIMVLVSDDNGSTFTVHAQTFSGDVGWGIAPGAGKRIMWDARKDIPNTFGENYQVMVFASDGVLGKDGSEMMLIPAGEFIMGSSPTAGTPQEYPQHTVFLKSFYIDKYEVTNADYYQFWVADGGEDSLHRPANFGETYDIGSWPHVVKTKPSYPVVGITWEDAQAYAKWAGKRLPTEAEWEKAARGTDARIFPWGNQFDLNIDGLEVHANIWNGGDGYDNTTSPVGTYPTGVSPFGVYDMAGNVWEWCADWFDDNYYSDSPEENPPGPETGDLRVIRGGSWYNSWRLAKSAYRIGIDPSNKWYMLGFRCVEDFDLTRADEGFAKSNIFALDTRKAPSWDVNEDGVVDIRDLVLVGKNFGESGDEIVGDVNADGTVDISDLVIIGRHFGEITKETPPPAPPSSTGSIAQLQLKPQMRGGQLYVELVGNALYDLYGFQFDVSFDYRKLEIISVTQGALLSANNSIHWREPQIYNRQGYIRGAAATILGSEYGITEDGTLATLFFKIKEPALKSSGVLALKNLKLIDSKGRSIPFSIKDMPLSYESLVVPNRFELEQNYPNPFNPETWLPYRLAQPVDVTIQIYDMKGRLIRNLKLGSKDAGLYLSRERAAYWDGTDEMGQRVSSGVYFYTIHAGDFTSTRRMILIK